jgi:hypothetical protein
MGTWDAGPFGNDDAADFAGELDDAPAHTRIEMIGAVLERVANPAEDDPRLSDAPRAVAAAALIAAQCPGGYPLLGSWPDHANARVKPSPTCAKSSTHRSANRSSISNYTLSRHGSRGKGQEDPRCGRTARQNWMHSPSGSATPATVEASIRRAVAEGWRPERPGVPHKLALADRAA